MKRCATPGCSNTAKGKYCTTCLTRRWKQKKPLKYAYQTLKDNAKRRGKPFNLTFEWFCFFAETVEYTKKKGITQKAIHIDRINEEKGYTITNIQPLPNAQNVRKYLDYKWNEEIRQMEFNTRTVKYNQLEGVPF